MRLLFILKKEQTSLLQSSISKMKHQKPRKRLAQNANGARVWLSSTDLQSLHEIPLELL